MPHGARGPLRRPRGASADEEYGTCSLNVGVCVQEEERGDPGCDEGWERWYEKTAAYTSQPAADAGVRGVHGCYRDGASGTTHEYDGIGYYAVAPSQRRFGGIPYTSGSWSQTKSPSEDGPTRSTTYEQFAGIQGSTWV